MTTASDAIPEQMLGLLPTILEHEVQAERARQLAKWGVQRYPNGTGGALNRAAADQARDACDRAAERDETTWAVIFYEEAREALAEDDVEALYAELVQVEAVARAWREQLVEVIAAGTAAGVP